MVLARKINSLDLTSGMSGLEAAVSVADSRFGRIDRRLRPYADRLLFGPTRRTADRLPVSENIELSWIRQPAASNGTPAAS
jgi:hypothetical protein